MKQLYLLRHGQSVANAQHRVAGSHDSPLSAIGQLQSRLAGQNAKRFFAIDLLVASPMRRARQTATLIADELGLPAEKVVVIEQLCERDLGSLEGLSYAQAPQYNGNYEDVESAPGVEPIQSLYERATSVFKQLQARPENNVLVVAHNGIGRMLRVVSQGGQPLDLYRQARLENAIIYQLN